jgi:hypothetical protein
LGTWGRDLYITAYPRVVHASEFLLAKGTFPATLTVGLRQSHVSPARFGARDATTGTKRWRRELWGASETKWAHALNQPIEK